MKKVLVSLMLAVLLLACVVPALAATTSQKYEVYDWVVNGDEHSLVTRIAKAEYDKNGNITSISYYDKKGKPVLYSAGYAKVVYEYDKKGNNTSISYYDKKGKPVLCNAGYAKVVYEYDKNGNLSSESFYNKKDKPVLCNDGYAKVVSEFVHTDGYYTLTKTYYGVDGEPVFCLYRGYRGWAKQVIEYE